MGLKRAKAITQPEDDPALHGLRNLGELIDSFLQPKFGCSFCFLLGEVGENPTLTRNRELIINKSECPSGNNWLQIYRRGLRVESGSNLLDEPLNVSLEMFSRVLVFLPRLRI
jgi:hypothetical protein